jgi:hypothetical protein
VNDTATHDRDDVAAGFSLWLIPPPALRIPLAGVIRDLSMRYRTPAFEPHITLAGDIPPGVDIIAKTHALARRLTACRVELAAAEWGTSYFHAVFLPLVHDESIRAAQGLASDMFGVSPDRKHAPHLSLVYGHLDDATKSAIVGGLTSMPLASFVVTELRLEETNGPTEAWTPVVTIPLG